MDGCTRCSLSGLFIWDRACHGASQDVKFVFYWPHGDGDVVLYGGRGVRDARVTYEFVVRRVEELTDVLRWFFAPGLAFQLFPCF